MKTCLTVFLIFFSLTCFAQSGSASEATLIDTIGSDFALEKIKLDSNEWREMGLDSLESYQPYFEYSIVSSFEISSSKLYIIERTSSNESYHWTCIINSDKQLVDWVVSAYDNSEGFASTMTRVIDNKLFVKEWNMYSQPEESITIYSIVGNKFKQ